MLHHASLSVSDIERSAAFYDAALAALGYVRVWNDIRPGQTGQAVGYGLPGGGDKLAIKHRPDGQRAPVPAFISHLLLGIGRRSIGFMRRQSRMAAVTMAAPACGPITGNTIMRRSSWISTDTLSKPCSIQPSNKSSLVQTSSGRSFGSNWMMVIHFAVSAGFFSFSISIVTS